MERFRSAALTLLLLSASACASAPAAPTATPTPTPGAGAFGVRAQPGDTLYIVEHYIRPERRQQFEDFVFAVLWPAFEQHAAANAPMRAAVQRIRMIGATEPDEDGTWTYSFVLDPAVAGESYNVLEILRSAHGEEEALRQYARYTETWARAFTTRPFVQHRNPQGQ